MNSSFLFRRRRWVLALLLVPALTFNPVSPLLKLSAQTSAPTTSTTSTTTTTTTTTAAPAGLAAPASAEMDKETGKAITTTQSGLKYVELAPGAGTQIKTGDEVTVKYTGMFPDGSVFDASEKHPPGTFTYTQGVTSLIPGWTEGTSTMKPGGKRKLIIPPNLGYGADGNQVIPPNSTLVFMIEVVAVKPG